MESKIKYIVIGVIVLILIIGSYFYYQSVINETNIVENISNDIVKKEEESSSENVNSKIFIDIKGAVAAPGVYELDRESKVIDAINAAGGLSKNAVTSNINLSKKLTDEMVIYVFSKSELKNNPIEKVYVPEKCECEVVEVNNCLEKENINDNNKSDNNDNSSLVNINKASLTELQNVNGIGESKAAAIIKYREENGYFKTIEDIKNVNGIGDSLFEKIKDYITV